MNKMDGIEKMYENKYRCPECGGIASSEQWDKITKLKHDGHDIFSIEDRIGNNCTYYCPICGRFVHGDIIKQII